MKRASLWVTGLILVLAVGAPDARGFEDPASSISQDPVDQALGRYNLHPSFQKLGRGLENFLGGWLEVPLAWDKNYAPSDTAASLFTGTMYGLVKGAVRTGVGAYEAVTFFLPYPEQFAPILPTLPYFQKTAKHRPLPLE